MGVHHDLVVADGLRANELAVDVIDGHVGHLEGVGAQGDGELVADGVRVDHDVVFGEILREAGAEVGSHTRNQVVFAVGNFVHTSEVRGRSRDSFACETFNVIEMRPKAIARLSVLGERVFLAILKNAGRGERVDNHIFHTEKLALVSVHVADILKLCKRDSQRSDIIVNGEGRSSICL